MSVLFSRINKQPSLQILGISLCVLIFSHNAAAVILAHNHPSGVCEPSTTDEMLTHSLKAALAMVDVKVLDHFIVAGNNRPLSFAERGLL